MTVTYVDEVDSSVFEIMAGDGASPEVFTLQCVANSSKSLSRKANTTTAIIPRCDDMTQPGDTKRTTTSLDTTLSFAGTFPASTGLAWFNGVGQTRNYQIYVGVGTGLLKVAGAFILESFDITGGELGKEVTATFSLSQKSAPTASAQT